MKGNRLVLLIGFFIFIVSPIQSAEGSYVQYIKKQHNDIPNQRAKKLVNTVKYYSKHYNISQNLIFAIIEQESDFKNIRSEVDLSPCSAGYMQLTRTTASNLARRNITCNELVTNWRLNIKLGVKYLRKMWNTTGHKAGAIGRYNGVHNLNYVHEVLEKRRKIIERK